MYQKIVENPNLKLIPYTFAIKMPPPVSELWESSKIIHSKRTKSFLFFYRKNKSFLFFFYYILRIITKLKGYGLVWTRSNGSASSYVASFQNHFCPLIKDNLQRWNSQSCNSSRFWLFFINYSTLPILFPAYSRNQKCQSWTANYNSDWIKWFGWNKSRPTLIV